jgi:hypothetical protein
MLRSCCETERVKLSHERCPLSRLASDPLNSLMNSSVDDASKSFVELFALRNRSPCEFQREFCFTGLRKISSTSSWPAAARAQRACDAGTFNAFDPMNAVASAGAVWLEGSHMCQLIPAFERSVGNMNGIQPRCAA